MARIEMTPEAPEDLAVAALFEGIRARGVAVPNLYRVLGASPDMLKAWIDFAWALRLEAKTPRGLRELSIMRGAQLSGVAYEWAHHRPMALKAGVDEAKLAALDHWRESDFYSEEERAVLQMTDEITAGSGAAEATMARLSALFTPEGVVELTLTASFYVCVSRLLTSLDVDVEPDCAADAAAFEADRKRG
ncbi:MAG: carboxymuconolactone decarboxylase family protein [Pseudomonadota bacterium]